MPAYNGSVAALAPDIIAAAKNAHGGFVIELGVQSLNGSTVMIQEGLHMRQYPESGVSALAPDIIKACEESNGVAIELGVFGGSGSTMMIQDALEAHNAPLHISVDWDDSSFDPTLRPTVPWWHFIKGDTRSPLTVGEALQIANGRKAGVIYIDTHHVYEQLRDELALWQVFADDKTVWLFHDTFLLGPENVEMNAAIYEFAAAHGWVFDHLREDSHGLGRLRREGFLI